MQPPLDLSLIFHNPWPTEEYLGGRDLNLSQDQVGYKWFQNISANLYV